MEKPGVQFTEKAWKDFLDFLKDTKESEDANVDQFVDSYYKQQKSAEPQKQRTPEEIEKLYNDIYEVMYHAGTETLSIPEIIEQLKPYGHHDINAKGFSATMNSVIAKYPEVYRPSRGAYAFDHDREDHPGEAEHIKYEQQG